MILDSKPLCPRKHGTLLSQLEGEEDELEEFDEGEDGEDGAKTEGRSRRELPARVSSFLKALVRYIICFF